MADIAEGTVTKVNKPMTGKSEHGDWTMYKFVITDSKGDHQCSTFSDSIGALIKVGIPLKFSYEDNEFTTKKGETIKEWRVNELFGDAAPSSDPPPLRTEPQPTPQRTLATLDPDFPYQYGRARSGAYQIAAAELATDSGKDVALVSTEHIDELTLMLYEGELAQVERMQHPESTTDAPSGSVEQSADKKPSEVHDWSWFWNTVRKIYDKDKEAVLRACGGLEVKDYMVVEGNPQTREEVLTHCVQFWADEPTVDGQDVPW